MNEITNLINEADVIIVMAGAGMSADSNLPTFRNNDGLWKAYPALKKLNVRFTSIANPKNFKRFSKFAWYFYGHRYELYKNTKPHRGYQILKEIVQSKEDYFVVTTNVDSFFHKAKFNENKIYEIHGRINKFQCTICDNTPWNAEHNFDIDPNNYNDIDIPTCPKCGATARPNILMFNDFEFNAVETGMQKDKYDNFLNKYIGKKNILIMEIGAGTAIPTLRVMGETLLNDYSNINLIRINPDNELYDNDNNIIKITTGCLEALSSISFK